VGEAHHEPQGTHSLSILFEEGKNMAAGAKPALDPMVDNKTDALNASDQKPATLKDRIIRKLTEIFEHNERLGPTRQ
jgi:hypothetical protein